jgi:glycosyltransferase involved in cell wall biosynthesis
MLGREPGLSVTIAHAGTPAWQPGLSFEERKIRSRRIFKTFRYSGDISGIAADFDVVVMMFDVRWLDVFCLLLRRPRRLVFWGHGFGGNHWVRALRLRLANRADALVLYGEAAADEFLALGFARRKLFVAGNTLVVSDHGVNEQTERSQFLFVGTLSPQKAVGDLLRAFAVVRSDLPQGVGITVVGKGIQYEELGSLAADLGIADRVSFKGWIHDDALLRKEFLRALAYVSPRHVGLGALHSFAYGVPVVTMPTEGLSPEVENIRDGVNGRLYGGSVSELAELLLAFARDPDQSWRLGRNAYKYYLEHRRPENMVAGLRDAILGRQETGASGGGV